MLRLPAWLVFLLFVPLQIWIVINLYQEWGFWKVVGLILVIGIVTTRAGRARGLRAWLFPGYAEQWERRRHIFQGILFLGAALTFYFTLGPQPWVPLLIAASAIKAAVA